MAVYWPEVVKHAKQEWGQLPDAPFEELERRRAWFVCLLQISHRMARDEAEREVQQWSAAAGR